MTYRHFSEGDRETIAFLKAQGHSVRKIAFYLSRSPSSVSRELRRNAEPARYRPHIAHRKAVQRRRTDHRRRRRLDDPALRRRVIGLLRRQWSPEIVAGVLRAANNGRTVVTMETVYHWIYTADRSLIRHLVRAHPRRRPRHQRRWPKRLIQHRVSIRQRPDFIARRESPGHWEVDLVIGKGQSALQVLVERQTRYVFIRRVRNKSAQASFASLSRVFSRLPSSLRQSVTYDNGVENLLHHKLNALHSLSSYFCEPYHAWEKGTVENTNGLIRRFLPKRTDFDTIPDLTIKKVEAWINQRPRKCLAFKSPAVAFQSAHCCTST